MLGATAARQMTCTVGWCRVRSLQNRDPSNLFLKKPDGAVALALRDELSQCHLEGLVLTRQIGHGHSPGQQHCRDICTGVGPCEPPFRAARNLPAGF